MTNHYPKQITDDVWEVINVVCPKCGYQWAIWKLGVPRDYVFLHTLSEEDRDNLVHEAAKAAECFNEDELEQYAEEHRHEIH